MNIQFLMGIVCKAIGKHSMNVTHHHYYSHTKIKETDDIILKCTYILILMNRGGQTFIALHVGLHMHKTHK